MDAVRDGLVAYVQRLEGLGDTMAREIALRWDAEVAGVPRCDCAVCSAGRAWREARLAEPRWMEARYRFSLHALTLLFRYGTAEPAQGMLLRCPRTHEVVMVRDVAVGGEGHAFVHVKRGALGTAPAAIEAGDVFEVVE